MKQTIKSLLAFAALMLCGGAWALEETFTCNASGLQSPKKVFPKVTTLDQLKTLYLGGKMGGNSITGQRAFSRVVFVESESSETELVYQFQLCDLNKDDDKHLKIAKVKFTVADEGGINAQQTAQGYVNNGGDGAQVGTVVTSMSSMNIAAYSVVDLHVSDVAVATAEVGGETKSFGRLSEALSAAETVTLTGEAVPAEGIMITRSNNAFVYAGETELEMPVYFMTGAPAKTVTKRGAGKVKLTATQAAATAGSFAKLIVEDGQVSAVNLFAGTIAVKPGMTYEFVGNASWDYKTGIDLAGGTLKSSGAATGGGKVQFYNMTVSADSTIDATSDFYSLGSGYNSFNYNLGGYTVTKTGSATYIIQTANFVGGGAFDVTEGSLKLRSVSVPASTTLALAVHEGATLVYENGQNKTGAINGNLDVTIDGGTLTANIAMPVRNLTLKLNSEAATVLPNNVTLSTTSSLGLTGVGTMSLGTARPTISAVPTGTALAVTLTAAEIAADKVMIPTTLTSVEDVKIRLGEDVLDATVAEGYITALAQDPNKVVIEDGETLTITSASQYSADKTIVVNAGCTLDMNGVGDCEFTIVLNGGKLTNTGREIGWSLKQTPKITLMADSEIAATVELGSVAGGHGQHDINLNGFTLTKTGAGDFWFTNAKFVGGGTVKVAEGTLRFRNGMALDGETTLEIAANATASFANSTAGETDSIPSFSTIVGAGTLVTKTIPTATLANETWSGTLVLKETGNLTGVNVGKLGNANSVVRFNGAMLTDANNTTLLSTVEVVNNGDTAGLTFGDRGYGTSFRFAKLIGNGTLATSGFSWYSAQLWGALKIDDASEFKGSLRLAGTTKGGLYIVAGSENPSYPSVVNQPSTALLVSAGATFGLGGTANSTNATNTVKGTLKVWTANAALLETAAFAEGSVIDLSEPSSLLTLPSTATGSALVVTGDRVRKNHEKLIAWEEDPDGFSADLAVRDGFRLVRKEDGYYLERAFFTITVK